MRVRPRTATCYSEYVYQPALDLAFTPLLYGPEPDGLFLYPSLPSQSLENVGVVKPRLAYFSPFPPMRSGISDYSIWLLAELKKYYTIDLFHDSGYRPDLGDAWHEFGCYDCRIFARRAALVHYGATLYQMGNSHYHKFLYDTFLRHPGVVTLHDFGLTDFHTWCASLPGAAPDYLQREVEYCYPDRDTILLPGLTDSALPREQIVHALMQQMLHLNRRIFENACRVIVHDPWCLKQVENLLPEYLEKTSVIPHGATVEPRAAHLRPAIRTRFGLPQDALLFAGFGSLHPLKMNTETVLAFAPVAEAYRSAFLLFVGDDSGGDEARTKVKKLGLEDRVRFLGRVSLGDFVDLAGAVDVGVSLRRPPSNGETSGGLLILLKAGVPTVVLDVGTFASYPDNTVVKIRWHEDGIAQLTRTFLRLAGNPRERARLGQAARAHLSAKHNWGRVAELYRDTLEHGHAKTITMPNAGLRVAG